MAYQLPRVNDRSLLLLRRLSSSSSLRGVPQTSQTSYSSRSLPNGRETSARKSGRFQLQALKEMTWFVAGSRPNEGVDWRVSKTADVESTVEPLRGHQE
jgi:hypothetical protein